MEEVTMYFELIIKPLEKEIKTLRTKVNKKRFSITKKIELKQLEKLELLLFNYYKKLGNFIDKDLNYNNKFNSN